MSESIGPISGIHHVTAIAGDPQRNLDFYVGLLGQRLVKKTINFDDPGSYHFYFADYTGSPGTLLTFFPWPRSPRGIRGSGEITSVAYVVPFDALDAWEARLREAGVSPMSASERFGQTMLSFTDPDGMPIDFVGIEDPPQVQPWSVGPLPAGMELRGFHSVTLQVKDAHTSAAVLSESFGWSFVGREGNRSRYIAPGPALGRIVDLVEMPELPEGTMGAGSIHHVAFRTPDDATQALWRTQLTAAGFRVTPMRDRQYFHSIYFNEPNGVLYEIATDPPGMAWDEPVDSLGETLKLPLWLEAQRTRIEGILPSVRVPRVTGDK